MYNSNTCIEYKLSFFRNTFCLDMKCELTRAITLIRNVHLNLNELAIVDALIALILMYELDNWLLIILIMMILEI